MFSQSVVLITESHAKGTVGFILNKPSDINLKDIMISRGLPWYDNDELFRGGPVNPSALIMVHTSEWYSSNSMMVKQGIAISSDDFMIEKYSMGNRPEKYRFINGMSGWAPGQLEWEIKKQKSWLTCRSTKELVFDYEGKNQWHKCLEACANETISQFI